MKVKFLGTGSPNSLSHYSSMLVDDHILIDCGPGTFKRLLNQKFDIKKIDTILITHLHGDHVFDIAFILFGLFKEDRNHDLVIIGNRRLKRKTYVLLKEAFLSWIEIIHSLNIHFINSKKLINKEIEINNFKVKSLKEKHGNLLGCYGYIINNTLFTGDVTYTDSFKEFINSNNIKNLVIECTMSIGNDSHIGVDNIVDISNNKDLNIIVTHMGNNSKRKLKEIKFKYNNVKVAEDDDVFDL